MGKVKSTNSKPELFVRKLLTKLGYRYRLHYRKLPGSPDISFPGRRKIIWIHGCFWHRHDNCVLARLPKTKLEFWTVKLEGNKIRDLANEKQIRHLGWDALIIWECQLRDPGEIEIRLRGFLD